MSRIAPALGVVLLVLVSTPLAMAQADYWSPMSTQGAASPREQHTAVWTGQEVIVWGGWDSSTLLNTGARYDPALDRWTTTSLTGAPIARNQHTAVWTGAVMLVWGGSLGFQNPTDSGAAYDPVLDTWTPISTVGAPSPRRLHTAVWTGTEMIVWGGFADPSHYADGGRYDPMTDTWAPLSNVGSPAARASHSASWTGSEMIIWGGSGGGGRLNTGGRYDTGLDAWTATSNVGAPSIRNSHLAFWTGSELLIWGGRAGISGNATNTGGRYQPLSDTWTATSFPPDLPSAGDPAGVWTGSELIMWGGSEGLKQVGRRYDPVMDSWRTMSSFFPPEPRNSHTATWTGQEMIIWAGARTSPASGHLANGGIYGRQLASLNADTGCIGSVAAQGETRWFVLVFLVSGVGVLLLRRRPGKLSSKNMLFIGLPALLSLSACAGRDPIVPAEPGKELTINDGARFATTRTVRLIFDPPTSVSPLQEMSFSSDGEEWLQWKPYSRSSHFELPAGEGEKTVYARATTADGVQVGPFAAAIILDSAPPEPGEGSVLRTDSGRLLLEARALDAVGVQVSVDGKKWGSWMAYTSHQQLPSGWGESAVELHLRYRDAAGNVSRPVILAVKEDPILEAMPRVRSLRVVGVKEDANRIEGDLTIDAIGMAHLEYRVDDQPVSARSEMTPLHQVTAERVGRHHRVRMRFWDVQDQEHEGEVVFQEPGPKSPDTLDSEEEGPGDFTLAGRVLPGVWVNGLDFDVDSGAGPRSLDSGTMAVVQGRIDALFWKRIALGLVGDFAAGDDARITSYGPELGLSLDGGGGERWGWEVAVLAGWRLSDLRIDDGAFGDFDQGSGFNLSLAGRLLHTRSVDATAVVEYRDVRYKYSEGILSGDSTAEGKGIALLLGVGYRF